MAAVGRFLRNWRDPKSGRAGYMFWCPGCDVAHSIATAGSPGPTWTFDGNIEQPTFAPSLLCFTVDNEEKPPKRETLCHLFVRAGQIEYLADSPHKLGGKTVPMEPIPSGYGGGED